MTLVTAQGSAACYCVAMKITYDPPPAPLGWLGRLGETALAFLVQILAILLPRWR